MGALPRPFRHISPPATHLNPGWGPCSYVLPRTLLKAALKQLNAKKIDQRLAEADAEFASAINDTETLVGYWRQDPLDHDLVRRVQPPSGSGIDDETIRWMGWNPTKVRAALDAAEEPYRWIQRGRQAYCGWLSCNPRFVIEHDALWAANRLALEQFGVPRMGPAVTVGKAAGVEVASEPFLVDLLKAFEQFLRRWGIAQLKGPRLPYPFGDQMPRLGPGYGLQPGHSGETLITYQVSRTAPSLPEGLLREVMEDASARDGASAHLTPWMQIVAKGNTARQTLDRYARLFRLQHYWRVLHERYRDACRRAQARLEPVFADYLGVSTQTIHADLMFIRTSLGAAWARPPLR